MGTLVIAAVIAGVLTLGYRLYGRWLGRAIFRLTGETAEVPPARRFIDEREYVPTGGVALVAHHAATIAGFAAIAGPSMAIAWGWLPALLTVLLGVLLVGGVADLGALTASVRGCGQSLAEAAGRVVSARARAAMTALALVTLAVTVAALIHLGGALAVRYPMAGLAWIAQLVLAGLLAAVAGATGWVAMIAIGTLPLIGLLAFGPDVPEIRGLAAMAGRQPVWHWALLFGGATAIGALVPVWRFAQQRALCAALLGLATGAVALVGMAWAAIAGGPPPVAGAARGVLVLCEDWRLLGNETVPPVWPLLLATAGCGAAAGMRCMVASGPTAKLLTSEQEATAVGYGGAVAAGGLAGFAVLACGAGLSLGARVTVPFEDTDGRTVLAVTESSQAVTVFYRSAEGERLAGRRTFPRSDAGATEAHGILIGERGSDGVAFTGQFAWRQRYRNWAGAWQVVGPVRSFVEGSANFLRSVGIPGEAARSAVALVVLLLLSAAAEGALRVARYVVQEAAARRCPGVQLASCAACGAELAEVNQHACPRCGFGVGDSRVLQRHRLQAAKARPRGLWARLLNGFPALVLVAAPVLLLGGYTASARPMAMGLWPAAGVCNLTLLAAALLVVACSLVRARRLARIAGIPGVIILLAAAWLYGARVPVWLSQGFYLAAGAALVGLLVAAAIALEVAGRVNQLGGVPEGSAPALNVVGRDVGEE